MPFKNPISIITASLTAGDPNAAHVVIDSTGIHVYDQLGLLTGEWQSQGGPFAFQTLECNALVIPVDGAIPNPPAGGGTIQSGGQATPTSFNGIDVQVTDTGVGPMEFRFNSGRAVADIVLLSIVDRLIPRGLVAPIKKSQSAEIAGTAEVKDAGIGDLAFVAISGETYEIEYICRVISTVANDVIDIYIRDGGVNSPTTASTRLTGASMPVNAAGGPGAAQLICKQRVTCPGDIAAGTHTIAAFKVRAAGTGNVNVGQSAGQSRELSVTAVGTGV